MGRAEMVGMGFRLPLALAIGSLKSQSKGTAMACRQIIARSLHGTCWQLCRRAADAPLVAGFVWFSGCLIANAKGSLKTINPATIQNRPSNKTWAIVRLRTALR